jgi:hypothetical protein
MVNITPVRADHDILVENQDVIKYIKNAFGIDNAAVTAATQDVDTQHDD